MFQNSKNRVSMRPGLKTAPVDDLGRRLKGAGTESKMGSSDAGLRPEYRPGSPSPSDDSPRLSIAVLQPGGGGVTQEAVEIFNIRPIHSKGRLVRFSPPDSWQQQQYQGFNAFAVEETRWPLTTSSGFPELLAR